MFRCPCAATVSQILLKPRDVVVVAGTYRHDGPAGTIVSDRLS
jgi:hypothetical protein